MLKPTLFCLSVQLSFFNPSFLLGTNFKYTVILPDEIGTFLLLHSSLSSIFWFLWGILEFQLTFLLNMMKCVLPNTTLKKCLFECAAMWSSKHKLCVLPNMKLELRNKGSRLQLAPKPTQYPYPKHSNNSKLPLLVFTNNNSEWIRLKE